MSSYSSSFFLGNTGPPSTPEFGKPIRNLFLLEEGTVFTNHGSYGAVPREVMEKRVQLLNTAEAHPDRWFRTTVRPLYDSAIADVANFVGADPKNLVFVQNATAAVNTVLKNLVLGPEDIILSNSHSYNACNNAIESAIKRCNADTLSLDLRFPIRSEEEVVEQVVEICKRNTGIRLAMVDHISSPSARVAKCHRYGRYICVKILKCCGKKCGRPRSFVKLSGLWVNSTSFNMVLSLNQPYLILFSP